MAVKKKRGRPKKKAAPARAVEMKRQSEAVADIGKPSDPLESLAHVADDLQSKVRGMFQKDEQQQQPVAAEVLPINHQKAEQGVDGSRMSQIPSSGSDVSQLAETVAQVKEQFGPSPDAGPPGASAPGPEPNRGQDFGPGVVEPPDHDFIPRETIRQLLEVFFSAASKRYGDQWKLSTDESRALTPVTVDMVNEQGPRLFAESANRALWIWVTVMGIFIAVRSEAGARLVEWISNIATGAGKPAAQKSQSESKPESGKKDSTQSAEDSTKPASLEFKEGLGFQAPAKPH
jgi:hypothetical protein